MTEPEKSRTQFQIAMLKLRRHRLGMTGGYILIALYLCALFADFIAPYGIDDQRRENSYNPPTRPHFFDANGKWIGMIETPECPANCTFGGAGYRTLFITARKTLYAIETQTRGWHIHLDGRPAAKAK